MKKISVVTSIAIASFIVGCGSSSHSSKNQESNISNSVISENNISSTNNSIPSNSVENNTTKIPSNQNSGGGSSYSYSTYSGGSTTNNTQKDNNEVEKSVKISNMDIKVAPSANINVDNKDAYTFSDLGIVTPIKFPKPEKVEETNETVEEVVKNTILKQKKKIYTISANAKVIKKPFTSADGKLAVLFKFNPKLKFDTTVAVTNYLTLLALPNNGLDLLKSGLEPIPEISGDIAFFDPEGNRKLDINKDFNSTNTSVDIYLFFKDLNLTDGDYKLYTYDYNGNYSVKDINVVDKTKKISVAMKNVSSFAIGKVSNKIESITEIIDSDKLPPNLKMGIVAFDESNKVVGVGELDGGVANVYTISKPTKYTYISYFLKNGKKSVTDLNDISMDDFETDKYPLDFSKLTSNDKNILYNIKQEQDYSINWNIVAEMIKPEKLLFKKNDKGEFNKDVTTFIESYIKSGKCNDILKSEYNLSYKNISIVKKSCDKNNLILGTKTSEKDGNYEENREIAIEKKSNQNYQIVFKSNYLKNSNEEINYNLILKPYGRILENSYLKSVIKNSDVVYLDNGNFEGSLKYIGDNNYLYSYTKDFYSKYSYEDENEILQYKLKGNANIFYNVKAETDILKNNSYEVYDIYSNEENVTINGKHFVFNYSKKTKESSINMYVETKSVTYNSNIVTFGNREVEFYRVGSSKGATFNLEENVTSETTYEDYANIKLPDVNSSTLSGKDGDYDADLTLIVEDLNGDNKVMFKIDNATIHIYDNQLSLLLIPKKTKILAYQEGLKGLSKIKSGETKIADIKNELINYDLEFNIDTLLNNLATNSDAIKTTLNELNDYLIKSRKYQVTLKIDTELPLSINTIKGIVKINKE